MNNTKRMRKAFIKSVKDLSKLTLDGLFLLGIVCFFASFTVLLPYVIMFFLHPYIGNVSLFVGICIGLFLITFIMNLGDTLTR